ncbi:matrixin family metalloprotease [Pseudoduganella sp. R-31]|uniref:matrixin family metalloprotease n=1 Tax=unclassified Pseudoduganella TaxID=2637179 RepID=UPI003CF24E3B
MKETAKFKLTVRDLDIGERHEDVPRVQMFLRRFGYLSESASTDGTFDEATRQAVKRFQAYHRLHDSGLLDDPTVHQMERPRCGNPDLRPPGLQSRFLLKGCSYWSRRRSLTFGFANATPDIAGDGEREAVRSAFRTWQQVAWVDFVEVPIEANPDLRIEWQAGDHGDGSAFDGVGRILAHAFYPPPCGGAHAGKCHFDEAEAWALGALSGMIDLETVALHEIGHLLGLDHSADPSSVMAPSYPGVSLRTLQPDDVAGIEALYGKRGPAMRVRAHVEGYGDMLGVENQFLGTRGESRRLEGMQLEISSPVPGLSIEYMGHVEGYGDTQFQSEGSYLGTRGQGRRLEGIAIRLAGPAAGQYTVRYMAHIEGHGDSALHSDGQFLGTRGESRRLEGLLVRIEKR